MKASDVGVDEAAQAAFRLMVRLAETEREQLPSTLEGLLTRIRQFGYNPPPILHSYISNWKNFFILFRCYEIQLNPQVSHLLIILNCDNTLTLLSVLLQVVIEALTKRGLIKLVETRKEGVIVSQQVVYQIQQGPKQV